MSLEIEDGFNFAIGQMLAEWLEFFIMAGVAIVILAVVFIGLVIKDKMDDWRYYRRRR